MVFFIISFIIIVLCIFCLGFNLGKDAEDGFLLDSSLIIFSSRDREYLRKRKEYRPTFINLILVLYTLLVLLPPAMIMLRTRHVRMYDSKELVWKKKISKVKEGNDTYYLESKDSVLVRRDKLSGSIVELE